MTELLPAGNSHTKLDIQIPLFVPIIMGSALVISALIGSYTFYAVRSLDNVLTVTGSTKVHVTSDLVKWHLNIARKVSESNMQNGYPLLAKDLEAVKAFLKTNGIPDDAITVSQVFVEEIYKYDPNGNGGPREFNLREEVIIESKEVKSIEVLSKNISEIAQKGVFLQSNNLEYFVTNLPELRVSLLGDAIKDAKARATEIAKAGGQSVGALKAASSGVVQVLAPNSIEVTDYGSYDTQSIEKDVMVTARATFFVR